MSLHGRDNRINDFVIIVKIIYESLSSNLRCLNYDRENFQTYVPALNFENGRHLNKPNDCPMLSPLASLVRQIFDPNQGPKIAL